ncbi:MAG: amidohydrolase family protein [Anaerolineae bacterium]|nr:amidohydrolase family protein [Anaerolineae bacterium]
MATAIINAQIVLPPEFGVRLDPNLALRFDSRSILSIDRPPQRGDTILDLTGRAIYPGLINAHDHLELNHYPRSKFRPVYANAHQWGEDFLPQLAEEPYVSLRRQPLSEQCTIGGIKNLRSGVTTVVHHNPLHPPLRSPDFPVRVVQHYGWAHSLHFEKNVRASFRKTPRGAVWMIHLAEGTDDIAAGELRQLHALGCLQKHTVLIHGVGLSAEDRQLVIAQGAGLVWCPSTNLFLLGATGDVRDFSAAGKLAIGTDSRLTADGDMFDELRAAARTGQLSIAALFRAVTTDAATMLRLRNVGTLLPGYAPDFFVAPASSDPYAALLSFTPHNLEAVYVGGQVRYQR